jgi:hypothetical protein
MMERTPKLAINGYLIEVATIGAMATYLLLSTHCCEGREVTNLF